MREPGRTQILERPGKPDVLRLQCCRLSVVRGPDAGLEIEIRRQTTRVGSGQECDVILSDASVSAIHFELTLGPRGALLRDLDSTNGTVVGDHRAVAIYLDDRNEITAGETVLVFSVLQGHVEMPLSASTNFGDLLGHSAGMRAAFAILEQAARTDSTILIQGESGTGKELAARAVHERSGRRDGPLVVVDCGAIPPTLVESHLFGHVKGAFTGADSDRPGAFEQADGGTLVLDEMGELPLELQAKLLRVVETRSVRPVGASQVQDVDVRLVVSTNRNLSEEVRKGNFREDLWYRISVIAVHLPPLRERREEIPRLLAHFLAKLGEIATDDLDPGLLEALMTHSWPGNVRELRNVVERLTVLPGMSPGFYLSSDSTAQGAGSGGSGVTARLFSEPFHEAKRIWSEQFEREYLTHLLSTCKHNISAVARASGLSRQSCHRLIRKHGLDRS